MWIGISLLVLSWLYPPWMYAYRWTPKEIRLYGFSFIFDTRKDRYWFRDFQFTIDYQRLGMIDLAVSAVTAGAMVTLARKKMQP